MTKAVPPIDTTLKDAAKRVQSALKKRYNCLYIMELCEIAAQAVMGAVPVESSAGEPTAAVAAPANSSEITVVELIMEHLPSFGAGINNPSDIGNALYAKAVTPAMSEDEAVEVLRLEIQSHPIYLKADKQLRAMLKDRNRPVRFIITKKPHVKPH